MRTCEDMIKEVEGKIGGLTLDQKFYFRMGYGSCFIVKEEPLANVLCSDGLFAVLDGWKDRVKKKREMLANSSDNEERNQALCDMLNFQRMIIEIQEVIIKTSND